ncbi:MAG: hypothetical protein COA36_00265 [Desulfotalea sp.]|nr:MAG: hypothetical protein COA36_00265 [Desulfotalea sp.]
MTHVKEDDLMNVFYHSAPVLQQKILAEYQTLTTRNRESLLSFLADKFQPNPFSRRNQGPRSNKHLEVLGRRR